MLIRHVEIRILTTSLLVKKQAKNVQIKHVFFDFDILIVEYNYEG